MRRAHTHKIFLEGKFTVSKEDGVVLAKCPELKIDTFGKDINEARKNLAEAINLYFETAKEAGSYERIIRKLAKVDLPIVLKDLRQNDYLASIPQTVEA